MSESTTSRRELRYDDEEDRPITEGAGDEWLQDERTEALQ